MIAVLQRVKSCSVDIENVTQTSIKKGMLVLKPNGDELNETNIGNSLSLRDFNSDLRAANPFHQGSGKTFSKQDKVRFLDSLERIIRMNN